MVEDINSFLNKTQIIIVASGAVSLGKSYLKFNSNKSFDNLKNAGNKIDIKEMENIIYKLQHLFVENAPGIPLFTELSWAEYNSKYFIDFPNAENPYGPLSPNESGFVLTLLNVKKR